MKEFFLYVVKEWKGPDGWLLKAQFACAFVVAALCGIAAYLLAH